MCVVYDGYTKAEACIAGEALDRKTACEVGRNYAMIQQRKCAWTVQRETGSPYWQSFEMTRTLSLM